MKSFLNCLKINDQEKLAIMKTASNLKVMMDSQQGDIKKEEMLLKIEDNEMEHDYLLEKKDSDEYYNKDALDELDEEWLTGPSW